MSAAESSVSVVIVNYNVRHLLEQCLLSLQRCSTKVSLQILVVDNASQDDSVSYLQSKFPEVEFIVLKENLGFAKANNLALKKCRGEFILILNPDTVVSEETLPGLISFLRANPRCGAVTPKLIRKDGGLDFACRRALPTPWVAFSRISGLSRLFPKSKLFARYNMTYLDDDLPVQIEAMTGAFILMPRAVYEKVGGFDERFFMYGEDLDLCARIGQAGFELHYRPETTVVHYRGESTRRSRIDRTDSFYGAMVLFAEKHYRGSARGFGLPLLKLGIALAKSAAGFGSLLAFVWPLLLDALLIVVALNLGQWLRWGAWLRFLLDMRVLLANVLLVLLSLAATGAYSSSDRKLVSAAFKGALLAGAVSGTYTFFLLRGIMFSRAVVLISAAVWSILLPGWRWLWLELAKAGWAKRMMRRPAIIVGMDETARILGTQLAKGDAEYELAGFVRYREENVNSSFGFDPLGSVDDLERIVERERISDVFFSTGGATYAEIVSLANRLAPQGVHFKVISAESPGSALPLFGVEWKTPLGIRGFWRRIQRRWGI